MTHTRFDPRDPALLERFRALARTLVADPDRADDLGQELWLRARGRSPLSAPFWAVAGRNLLRSRARTTARRDDRERQVARAEASEADAPDRLAEIEEQRIRVATAVRGLPAAERDVIVARYWEGRSPSEIAKQRGEPASSVRARLTRATARLRRLLDERHGGDRRAWAAPLVACLGAPPGRLATLAARVGELPRSAWPIAAAALVTAVMGIAIATQRSAQPSVDPSAARGGPLATAEPRAELRPAITPRREAARPDRSPPDATRDRAAPTALRPEVPRLLDHARNPLVDVAYWRGAAPEALAVIVAPLDIGRTGPDGGFDARTAPGSGPWLWFELAAGHFAGIPAAPDDSVRPRRDVTAPEMVARDVVLHGVRPGEPWRLTLRPLDSEAGRRSGRDAGGEPAALRVQTVHLRGAGPTPPTVTLFATTTYEVSAVFRDHAPSDTHQHRGSVLGPLRVGKRLRQAEVRVAGTVPGAPDVAPLWVGLSVRTERRILETFDPAGDRIGWMPFDVGDPVFVVLPDGEHSVTRLTAEHLEGGEGLVVLPGSGRPARTLPCQPTLPDPAELRVLVEDRDGGLRSADRVGVGEPFLFLPAQFGWRKVGDTLQLLGGFADSARVFVLASDGRLWVDQADTLVGIPAVPVRSPDLAAVSERHGAAGRARIVLEIRLPEAPRAVEWTTLREALTVRDARGWWLTPDGAGTVRMPLPDPWQVAAPRGIEWRFRAGPAAVDAQLVDVTR